MKPLIETTAEEPEITAGVKTDRHQRLVEDKVSDTADRDSSGRTRGTLMGLNFAGIKFRGFRGFGAIREIKSPRNF